MLVRSLPLPTILFIYNSHQTQIFKNLYIHTCHLWIPPGFHWNLFHHNIKTNVLWLIFIFFYHYTAVNIDWSYIVYQMLSHIILHTVAHDLIRPLVVLILLQMRKHTASCLRSQTIAQENKSWVNAKSSACATNGWSWNSCTGVLYAHFSII